MEAPSERHLEDWLWDNPEALGTIDGYDQDEYYLYYDFQARQYPLPSGIADIIATSLINDYEEVMVIELKKGEIDHRAFAQVLRYVYDLNAIWRLALNGSFIPVDHSLDQPQIAATLIGYGASDDILIAARACNVDILRYEFDGTGYTFEELTPAQHLKTRRFSEQSYLKASQGLIRQICRDVWNRNVEIHVDENIRQHMSEYDQEFGNKMALRHFRSYCGSGNKS